MNQGPLVCVAGAERDGGDREEGKKGEGLGREGKGRRSLPFSPVSRFSPSPFCACHAGYGTRRFDDCHDNENLNKVKGLISKTAQQLCTCITPFCLCLFASLRYDEDDVDEMPSFISLTKQPTAVLFADSKLFSQLVCSILFQKRPSLLAEVSHDEAKMRDRRETFSLLFHFCLVVRDLCW